MNETHRFLYDIAHGCSVFLYNRYLGAAYPKEYRIEVFPFLSIWYVAHHIQSDYTPGFFVFDAPYPRYTPMVNIYVDGIDLARLFPTGYIAMMEEWIEDCAGNERFMEELDSARARFRRGLAQLKHLVEENNRHEQIRVMDNLHRALKRVDSLIPKLERTMLTLSVVGDVQGFSREVRSYLKRMGDEDLYVNLRCFGGLIQSLVRALACFMYEQPLVVVWKDLLVYADVDPTDIDYSDSHVNVYLTDGDGLDRYPHAGAMDLGRSNIVLPDGREIELLLAPNDLRRFHTMFGNDAWQMCDMLEWLLGNNNRLVGRDDDLLIIQYTDSDGTETAKQEVQQWHTSI